MPATKFDKPVFPGAKLVSATVTVTNTSGSYSNTFTDERIATSMRAFQLEIEDPSVFNDKISITTADGSFTIACDEVAGETDVTVGFLKIADDPTAISSTEFTVLNNRIGDLSDLETTDQTSMVNAVNEVVGDVSDNTQAIANVKDNLGLENAIADCDSQIVRIAVTNSNTLNTPYKAGLSDFANGCSIIGDINTSDNYIQQIYMSNGETRLFIRRKYNGAWQSWRELATASIELNTGSTVSGSGGTATISVPSGVDWKNIRIIYSYLNVGTNNPRYYDGAASVTHVDSSGIHVVNNGGAAGVLCVGILVG